ncbi:hypothetical protein P8452_74028 [Trifolium repens]|nr:hypothetical protein P8452_74028 [Trifolium repens]
MGSTLSGEGKVEIPDGFPFEIEDNPGERTIQLTRKYEDDNEKNDSESSIPLVVNVFKGNGVCVAVTAFSDEVSIDSLSIKKPNESEDELVYEGPEFTDLNEKLHKAFPEYLEIRGISPITTNFLQESEEIR